jgi:FRG domain
MRKKPSKSKYIKNVSDLIGSVESFMSDGTVLFRGQDCDDPLLPKIARQDPSFDTSGKERDMLEELKRRSAHDASLLGKDDWDCLVYAQHYGMATRLLDWTTNPLVALWFAARDLNPNCEGYVFLLFVDDDKMLNKQQSPDPFAIGKTKVLKPSLNNPRVIAQAGWFTAHRYSKKAGKFVDLHKIKEMKRQVLMKGVPGASKAGILKSLDKLGVNEESIFRSLEGTCHYINWVYGIGSKHQ